MAGEQIILQEQNGYVVKQSLASLHFHIGLVKALNWLTGLERRQTH
jgi:hypothetical protein